MKIYLLQDYKGLFGSKYPVVPYRSGMDCNLLNTLFLSAGYEPVFMEMADIDFRKENFKDQVVLYTSSEDIGSHYKDYIEDILLGIQLQGGYLLPDFKYFRAHNNKVFMEILRDLFDFPEIKNIASRHFGTLEDLIKRQKTVSPQSVIKSPVGAVSSGVSLSSDIKDLLRKIRRVSRIIHLAEDVRDIARSIRRKGYVKESVHRNKFLIQNLVPDLTHDWKVLVFGTKYYFLKRQVRQDDFRASGSGLFTFTMEVPPEIFSFASRFFELLNVPHVSFDIGFDGTQVYLFEFQVIYFGTYTLTKSPYYFIREENGWTPVNGKSVLEQEYVNSIDVFIKTGKLSGTKE